MRKIRLMEVCGTHTMAIAKAGIKKVLPSMIELISGPGCPVCVSSQSDIDKAIEIAKIKDVIVTTFGDMMRVPGTTESLANIKQQGADVRVVYSALDAVYTAKQNPNKKIVFIGVGFETTSPTIASAVLEAEKERLDNFFILSNFKLIMPALFAIASSGLTRIDGFICPGHVSVITGTMPYEKFARRFKKPCVITGFDEDDIIKGITRLIKQVLNNTHKVEIEYKRAVDKQGNIKAQQILQAVFKPADAQWRGIGVIKKSGLLLRDRYSSFDADNRFRVKLPKPVSPRGCICGKVLQGINKSSDCRLFKNICTPEKPQGPCMVSSEGSCAAYYKYGV
jgi:hydrogenase expression/formation protein HypD